MGTALMDRYMWCLREIETLADKLKFLVTHRMLNSDVRDAQVRFLINNGWCAIDTYALRKGTALTSGWVKDCSAEEVKNAKLEMGRIAQEGA